MGTFIVVCLAMTVWITAAVYGLGEGIRYWRLSQYSERLGNQLEAVARFGLGVCLFIIGLAIMSAVLPTAPIIAMIFGPAFLGEALWTFRHYRRNWRRFAQGGHRREVLAHLIAIPGFAVIGISILIAGL